MAKAKLTLPDGPEVLIDGTPDEIKELLAFYSSPSLKKEHRTKSVHTDSSERRKLKKSGPADLIRELIEENYFKGQKRSLADIQRKLEEGGHIYAQTSLSTPLIRLTKSKELRRLKDKKGWMYVV